jgi:hypothetical protein
MPKYAKGIFMKFLVDWNIFFIIDLDLDHACEKYLPKIMDISQNFSPTGHGPPNMSI